MKNINRSFPMIDHIQLAFNHYIHELDIMINDGKVHSVIVYTQFPHHNGPIEYIDIEIAKQINFHIYGLGIVRFEITLK